MKTIQLTPKQFGTVTLGMGAPFGLTPQCDPPWRCQCGNGVFVIAQRNYLSDDGVSVRGLDEYRSVCPKCTRFRSKDMIVGEIDYVNMIVTVKDKPEKPAPRLQSTTDSEYLDGEPIAEWIDRGWLPEPIVELSLTPVKVVKPKTTRRRKAKAKPDDPSFL